MENLLDFLLILQNLKTTKRTGWVNNKVSNPESISDHMHRMSVIAMLLPIESNRDRLIKMALVHDIAEAVVGDITPSQMTKADKATLELSAMQKFSKDLGPMADEMLELWMEYEAGETKTAIICKDIDKFEMILQAFEYEKDGHPQKLDEFFSSTEGKFKHPSVVKLVDALYKKRNYRK